MTMITRTLAVLFAVILTGCDADSPLAPSRTPVPPVPPPVTVTPPPQHQSQWTLTGALRTLGDNAPIPNGQVTFGPTVVPTDTSGAFRLEAQFPPSANALDILAPGFLPRRVSPSTRAGALRSPITLISLTAPFSQPFYEAFARGAPQQRTPLFTWPGPSNPNFYIQTGGAMGQSDVPLIESIMRDYTPRFTGNRFQAGEIRTGTEPFSQLGWITISANSTHNTNVSGRAFVGANPGRITFNVQNECGDAIGAGTIVHELGHALGFWHVQGQHHAMHPIQRCGGAVFSAEEAHHAWVAYQRPRGNTAPDDDTGATTVPQTGATLACTI